MKHPGVRAAMKLDAEAEEATQNQNSEVVPMSWKIGASSEGLHIKKRTTYRSHLRLMAQKLCGWTTNSEDLDGFILKCEADNEYSRAAAVAIFCLQLNTALQVLDRGAAAQAEQAASYHMVSISLSGFASGGDGLWKRMVRSHQGQIENAYLRAAFLFLTADDAEEESYKAILALDGLELSDKVSFGCVYLSDEKLSSVINEFWTEYRNRGDLRGLVLCGMGTDGVELLQSYLDHTGDIQSVCWLVVRCLEPSLAVKSVETEESVASRLQQWFVHYKDLLDAWQMWETRATFDCAIQMAQMRSNAPQQVYISCTYCGGSVARNMKGLPPWVGNGTAMGGNSRQSNPDMRAISTFTRQANTKRTMKVQACPQCRKDLPRCAVCLLSMGTHSGLMLSTERPGEGSRRVTPFRSTFTWCQTCRHGGHAEHITNWFAEHADCPISGCGCKCATVDPLSQIVPENNGCSSPAATQTEPLTQQRRD